MTFRDPLWLWGLAAIPLVVLFLVARERLRQQAARRFVSERLRSVAMPLRSARPWLLAAALALAVLALAGPSRGFITIPISDRETNRVIVLDVSNSMLADDVGASRLTAAKAIAKRLIESANGRLALVEFEAVPEVVAPLTSDSDAVAAMLDSIQAGEVGQAGSDFGAALAAALDLVEADVTTKADVVLISDGEEQGTRLRDVLRRAHDRGISVSTILVGTTQGSTIPMPAGPLQDEAGRVVTTYAHPEVLQQIAGATGGTFVMNPFPAHALDSLLVGRGGVAKQRNIRIPIDRYQWPLSLAFALLFIGSVVNRGAE
jgi:Ca-activated chloride channel family protein